jgi:hypothetical protein
MLDHQRKHLLGGITKRAVKSLHGITRGPENVVGVQHQGESVGKRVLTNYVTVPPKSRLNSGIHK